MTQAITKENLPVNEAGHQAGNTISFIDLKAQYERIEPKIQSAIQRVLTHGKFILGPEVRDLEDKLSEFCGVKHSITCANGTDALVLGLMALDLKPGQGVLVPSFTYTSSAEAIALTGALPIFVDINEKDFNIDPESLKQSISVAKSNDIDLAGIIAVDLFGQPADYDEIQEIARNNDLWVMADAAQSFGASYKGKNVGQLAKVTTTSFFPAKPLGCYGDGGAVFTDDDELAERLQSLRVHGKGSDKYDNVRIGMNSRLDTIQAAILLEKLKIFPQEITARQAVADDYSTQLSQRYRVTVVASEKTSVWAQYTLVVEKREELAARLKENDVPTAVYYPKPLHEQTAYSGYVLDGQNLNTSSKLSKKVLSLPMHPYLDKDQKRFILTLLTDN